MTSGSMNRSVKICLRTVKLLGYYVYFVSQQSFGYTYGPVVDDKMLKHPHVCPFKRLSDEVCPLHMCKCNCYYHNYLLASRTVEEASQTVS